MNRHLKRMPLFVLALLMILTMSACQTGTPAPTTAPTAAPTVAPTAAATTAPAETTAEATETAASSEPPAADGAYAKYDPPVTIHAARMTRANIKFIAGEDYVNNAWSQFMSDKLGINVDYKWMVDETEYPNKVNLSLAAGDIPDYFWVDTVQEQKLVNEGQILDITDIFNQYASPMLKKIVQGDPFLYKTITINDRLYSMPAMASKDYCMNVLLIRKDWLDKLGLQPPKTMQDLFAAMDAFVNKDPDGNGQKDTIGISLNNDMTMPAVGVGDIAPLFTMFKAYPDTWIKDASGNNLVYGGIQPEIKQALANMADLYKKGLIDPEFAVKDQAKVAQDMVAGKSGIEFGVFWSTGYPWQDAHKADPKLVLLPMDVPTYNGEPVKSVVSYSPMKSYVVGKTCEHPDAVIKMQGFIEQCFWGSGDMPKAWRDYAGNEKYKEISYSAGMNLYPIVVNEPPTLNYDLVGETTRAVDAGDPNAADTGEGATEAKMILDFNKTGDPNEWGMPLMRYGANSATGISNMRQDKGYYVVNEFWGVPGPAQTEKGNALRTMQLEEYTKIIMGQAPIDDFDNFVASWKASGGDDITTEINAWYQKNK